MSAVLRKRIGNSSALMLYASMLFVVFTFVAMWLYPGGSVFDKTSDHYLFLGNFFSDLGATQTPSALANLASLVFFVAALVVLALAMINFSSSWRAVHARRRKARLSGACSQLALMVSALGFFGVAATPWNHYLAAHNVFVKIAFGSLLVYVLCLLRVQLKNHWPRRFIAFNVLYLALLAAYVAILFVGPTLDTAAGFGFQAVAQKIIAYASILNIGLQALGVRGHLSAL